MALPRLNPKQLKVAVTISLLVVAGILVGYLVVRANPDYISDTFADETKIGKGTAKVEIATSTGTGQVTLAQCYTANPSWNWSTTTIVRDINVTANSLATTTKQIFCDDYNCVLFTQGTATPTAPVCIATDANVYVNILWSKTDVSGTKVWSNSASSTAISGGDIGGTHASGLIVGNNSLNVGTKNWLERYYASTTGTYLAMDSCKAKGNAWRLPTILELDSIRDQAKGGSPYSRLPNVVASDYWSSSEYSATVAYNLVFSNGSVNDSGKSSGSYVRCVRGQ